MATFQPFPRLPAELRAQIWEMTVEPRIVEVRLQDKRTTTPPKRLHDPFLFSSTPVPAPLQTCQEAQNARLYQCVFPDLVICNCAPNDSQQRYVWLNFDIDMISIGDDDFDKYLSVAHMIKRLRFERDNTDGFWFRGESAEIDTFINTTEIHVVLCKHGEFENWHGASEDHSWPCGKENVVIVDPSDGHMMKLMDLEEKYDRLVETRYAEENPGEEISLRNGQVLYYLSK